MHDSVRFAGHASQDVMERGRNAGFVRNSMQSASIENPVLSWMQATNSSLNV